MFSPADELTQREIMEEIFNKLPYKNPLRNSHPDQGYVYLYDAMQAIGQLKSPPDYLLIDALKLENQIKQDNLIKGDSRIWSIAAASIIAKVTRDRIMDYYHQKHPSYGFNRHKGYGTREHFENIRKIGICSLHRLSYRPISESFGFFK